MGLADVGVPFVWREEVTLIVEGIPYSGIE